MRFPGSPLLPLLLCATVVISAPCDIYGLAGTPCVGAYSLVRSLYAAYSGPLYQVIHRPSNDIRNIYPLTPGGYVNASSQDELCGVPSTTGIPPLGTNVSLDPLNMATYSFRHCDAQGFITPNDGSLDHIFTLVAGLNGAAGAVSFRSTNFPTWYIAPIATAEPGRLGLVEAPPSDAASWTITPASGGGLTLTNVGRPQFGMGVGNNLTGACAANYHSPSASVYLTDTPTPWVITPASGVETCEILRLFDQSPQANHLDTAPPGGAVNHPDKPVNAAAFPITVGGNKAYGAFFQGGMGYRKDLTSGVAKGDEPETIYMVNSGKIYNNGCCFDFGNAEANNHDNGAGTMECVYFGGWNATSSGWCGGSGPAPFYMADLEDGLWACNETHAINPGTVSIDSEFVVGMVKGGSGVWAIKAGDAQQQALGTQFEGPRPPGYNPMKKEGSILLGIGGDNSDSAIGVFFEGVVLSGYSNDASDAEVMEDIYGAGYGK